MEHAITAPHGGIVRGVTMAPGDVVREGYPIVFIQEAAVAGGAVAAVVELDPDHIRDDLRENYDRHAFGLDENRPEAVARRRKLGYRMPRENIDRLVDPGSFKEYWPLVVARQHQRQHHRGATQNTPGDGVVAAWAPSTARCSTRRGPAPSSSTTTTPCWRARRGTAITTSRIGSSSWRSDSSCRSSCSARAAAADRARTTSAPASRSIRTRSRPSRS